MHVELRYGSRTVCVEAPTLESALRQARIHYGLPDRIESVSSPSSIYDDASGWTLLNKHRRNPRYREDRALELLLVLDA